MAPGATWTPSLWVIPGEGLEQPLPPASLPGVQKGRRVSVPQLQSQRGLACGGQGSGSFGLGGLCPGGCPFQAQATQPHCTAEHLLGQPHTAGQGNRTVWLMSKGCTAWLMSKGWRRGNCHPWDQPCPLCAPALWPDPLALDRGLGTRSHQADPLPGGWQQRPRKCRCGAGLRGPKTLCPGEKRDTLRWQSQGPEGGWGGRGPGSVLTKGSPPHRWRVLSGLAHRLPGFLGAPQGAKQVRVSPLSREQVLG